MASFALKRGDTYPVVRATLRYASTPTQAAEPLDLSGAGVELVVHRLWGGSIAVACEVSNPTEGEVRFGWNAALEPLKKWRRYRCEFRVTRAAGGGGAATVQSVPSDGYAELAVIRD